MKLFNFYGMIKIAAPNEVHRNQLGKLGLRRHAEA